MRRPIRNHTKRGELVYEPFLGTFGLVNSANAVLR